MEDAAPEAAVTAVGQHDAHLGLAVGEGVGDGRHRAPRQAAIGAVDELERDAREPVLAPRLGQLVAALVVDDEVHGSQVVRVQRPPELERPSRGEVEPVDEDEDGEPAHDRCPHRSGDVDLQLTPLSLVLARQPHQEDDHDRDEHHDEPGTVGELRDGDDHVDDQRHHRTGAVDEEPEAPARLLLGDVVLGHAGLGERERREHADGVERDQAIDLGPGEQEQDDRRHGQEDDAVREHEAVSPLRELARHEVVAGVERRQTGEVGEARVGGEHQDQHRARLQSEVEQPAQRAPAVHEVPDL